MSTTQLTEIPLCPQLQCLHPRVFTIEWCEDHCDYRPQCYKYCRSVEFRDRLCPMCGGSRKIPFWQRVWRKLSGRGKYVCRCTHTPINCARQ